MRLCGAGPKHCSQETTLPKGITAGAAFAETLEKAVFYGALSVASVETMGAIKLSECATGFTLDAGFQMGINAIVKKYLNESFTTKQLVKEISWPSAVTSCATAALVKNCGTGCAGVSGFVVGFGDDILNQLKSGKSVTEIEVSQSTLNGIKQAILNILVQKIVTFGIDKISAWRGKYSSKQVEDALADLEKNPAKYGTINGINRYIAKTAAELEEYLSTLINKPFFEKYKGDFYRTVGNKRDPFLTHYIPKGKSQRYSKPGEDGLFFSSSKEGNIQELKHWDVPVEGNTTTFIYKNIESEALLDLTNTNVREKLGIELNQIIGDSYEFTDVIGTWARKNNYEGIIYPSARGTQYNNYFINVILFKSSTANKIVKGKIIEKIIN